MEEDSDDKNFISQLDELGKRIAKEELNEKDDEDRKLAVDSLRNWALEQKWLKCPTDFAFLLRFLRARKFSQLRARELLENYWSMKIENPTWLKNLDTKDKVIVEILKSGIFVVPKLRDKHGRRVIFERPSKIDLRKLKKKWGVVNLYRAMILVSEWFIRDEHVQVNGFVCVIDYSNVTWSQAMAIWDTDNEKKIVNYFHNCIPGRMKGLHMYNQPSFFEALFSIIGPFLKQKTRERIYFPDYSTSRGMGQYVLGHKLDGSLVTSLQQRKNNQQQAVNN